MPQETPKVGDSFKKGCPKCLTSTKPDKSSGYDGWRCASCGRWFYQCGRCGGPALVDHECSNDGPWRKPAERANSINSVPAGGCFRELDCTFLYLRISDTTAKLQGLDVEHFVYGVASNGCMTAVTRNTEVMERSVFVPEATPSLPVAAAIDDKEPAVETEEPPRDAQFVSWSCGCLGLIVKDHCWIVQSCDSDSQDFEYGLYERPMMDRRGNMVTSEERQSLSSWDLASIVPKRYTPLPYKEVYRLLVTLSRHIRNGQVFNQVSRSLQAKPEGPVHALLCRECERPVDAMHGPNCSRRESSPEAVTWADARGEPGKYPPMPTQAEARERHEDESNKSLAQLSDESDAVIAAAAVAKTEPQLLTCPECHSVRGSRHAFNCSAKQPGTNSEVLAEHCLDVTAGKVTTVADVLPCCLTCGRLLGNPHTASCVKGGQSAVTREDCGLPLTQLIAQLSNESNAVLSDAVAASGRTEYGPRPGQDARITVLSCCLACGRAQGDRHTSSCVNRFVDGIEVYVIPEHCVTKKAEEDCPAADQPKILSCPDCDRLRGENHADTCCSKGPGVVEVRTGHCVNLWPGGQTLEEVIDQSRSSPMLVCLTCGSHRGTRHAASCPHSSESSPEVAICHCVEEC